MVITVFIIFIWIQASSLSFLCQGNHEYETCKEPFKCANVQNMTTYYPFWGGGRLESCGRRGFELKCDDEDFAKITIDSKLYRVLSINDGARNLTVARDDLQGYDLCPPDVSNTTLDFTLFDYAPEDKNLTLYYNCPQPNEEQRQHYLHKFNCGSDYNPTDNTINIFMVEPISTGNVDYYYMRQCKRVVSVPITQKWYQILTKPSASRDELRSALRDGFGLRYLENNDDCSRCSGSGGICGQDPTTNSFACHCKNGPDSTTCSEGQGSKATSSWMIKKHVKFGVAFGLGGIVILAVVLLGLYKRQCPLVNSMFLKKKKKEHRHNIEEFMKNYGCHVPKEYKYAYVKKMTNSFTEKLGGGGYGSVYKGKLSDGQLVAVKILNKARANGEEFINEVASISRTSHVNIVTLLGFCYTGKKTALIYEFLPNGSLDKFIYGDDDGDNCHLESKKLIEISIGVARGLDYLHRGCTTQIVHFDIKPQNIPLDEDFCPKIADFGLAKLCVKKESSISMIGARGTIGFIAPEVFCKTFGGASHNLMCTALG